MIFDRKQQRLLLEGTIYTPEEIARLVAEGAENHPSALWDLYLFLNEWFSDSPAMTVHTSGSTGTPKELTVRKDQMMQSARLTCEYLNLQELLTLSKVMECVVNLQRNHCRESQRNAYIRERMTGSGTHYQI